MIYLFSQWVSSMIQIAFNYMDYYTLWLTSILDYYTPGWRLYLLSPFIILFLILPMLILIYLYLCSLFMFVFYRRKPILEAFQNRDAWEGCRRTMVTFWNGHGWIWHGYEVVGLENIPDNGPALIIYYHGAIPVDIYYLISNIYMEKGRIIRNVMDNFALKIPGLSRLFHLWGSFPGPRSKVVEFLQMGEIVSIAPGGVREALFSENYSLVWEKRIGFAKAAIEAQVRILPVFTQNCRQAFDFIGTGRKLFRKLYEKTRWPIMPLYGGFPVKMKTYVGKPIYYDPTITPTALAKKVNTSLQELISLHQHQPGSIWKGLWQRLKSTEESIPTYSSAGHQVKHIATNSKDHNKSNITITRKRRNSICLSS